MPLQTTIATEIAPLGGTNVISATYDLPKSCTLTTIAVWARLSSTGPFYAMVQVGDAQSGLYVTLVSGMIRTAASSQQVDTLNWTGSINLAQIGRPRLNMLVNSLATTTVSPVALSYIVETGAFQ